MVHAFNLAIDLDGTAIDTPYPSELKYEVYSKFRPNRGLRGLVQSYNVYFITARKMDRGFEACLANLRAYLGDITGGIITNVYHYEKESIAKALSCIALIDDDYRCMHSTYTIAIGSDYLDRHRDTVPKDIVVVKGLDDAALIEELEFRQRIKPHLRRINDLTAY